LRRPTSGFDSSSATISSTGRPLELDIVHVVVSHRVPSGREQMQQLECRSQTYSINSSAPSKNASDMFSPSAWAVLRLITSWFGCPFHRQISGSRAFYNLGNLLDRFAVIVDEVEC
jgi:hypothetical protein